MRIYVTALIRSTRAHNRRRRHATGSGPDPAGSPRAPTARRKNAASFRSSRSYWGIIRTNLFNFFNNILFAIGIALIALGQYNTDAGFGTAATIVAQTALSTFVSFAAFGLILFLEPPFRLFSAWSPVSPDKRPALLALALAVIYCVL